MNLASISDGHPDERIALLGTAGPTTYGQLRVEVGSVAGQLLERGVATGDRVGLVAANSEAFVVAALAVLAAGAVVVPLNPHSPPAEIDRELRAVEAAFVIAGPGGAAAAERGGDSRSGGAPAPIFTLDIDLDGGIPLQRDARGPAAGVVDRSPGDLAALLFTAGTGGSPKAAMLTHGNLLANLEQVQRHPGRGLHPDDVCLGVLPMFHIFGLNVVLFVSLFAGASVVLLDHFDPQVTLDAIRTHGVTVLAGAPPMYAAWAGLPGASPAEMASVRLAVSGAAALPAEVAVSFERCFGIGLREGYGLTEASPVVTSSVIAEEYNPGSIGVPIPGVDVRLVDEDGEDALVGDAGEIWVRGPNVFPGYWHDDDATGAVLTPDGWLRTGDVAVAGDDGELYLVDRVKDLIIVSGFNVYPAEVEDALLTHPAVREAAVIGEPHGYSGEAVKAYVVLDPGSTVTEAELIEHCARRLARYKCPSDVVIVPSLPRGMAGKLLRRQLH